MSRLNNRQTEVLTLVAEGLSYKEVGARLFISPRTVRYHMGEIMNQLHMENRAQVRLGPAVDRAIVTENLVSGKPRVENKARNGVVIVKDNAGTPDTKRWAREMERRKTFRAAAWRAGERDGK